MFVPNQSDNGAVLPWSYLAAAAGTYKAGQMLAFGNGLLAPITAARNTTPPYLCMGDVTVTAGGELPVTYVSKDFVYETALSAATPTAAPGVQLNVAAGGLQLGGAAGTFKIVSLDGTAAGDTVKGRWM
jgi:hypothetical protein